MNKIELTDKQREAISEYKKKWFKRQFNIYSFIPLIIALILTYLFVIRPIKEAEEFNAHFFQDYTLVTATLKGYNQYETEYVNELPGGPLDNEYDVGTETISSTYYEYEFNGEKHRYSASGINNEKTIKLYVANNWDKAGKKVYSAGEVSSLNHTPPIKYSLLGTVGFWLCALFFIVFSFVSLKIDAEKRVIPHTEYGDREKLYKRILFVMSIVCELTFIGIFIYFFFINSILLWPAFTNGPAAFFGIFFVLTMDR